MRFVDTNILLYSISRAPEERAAILEAARSCGCEIVLSEDLSDRESYDGVRVEDPFYEIPT